MSISLAQSWVRSAIRDPNAKVDVLNLLDGAQQKKVTATLVVGSELSTSGAAFLTRWDGTELSVSELTSPQQRTWDLPPNSLIRQLDSDSTLIPVISAERVVAISVSGLVIRSGADGSNSLCGVCRYVCDEPMSPIVTAAIQAHYFRPGLGRQRSGIWHADRVVGQPGGEMRFSFALPWLDRWGRDHGKPLAVFVQMFSADNWSSQLNCRRISNMASAFVDVK